MRRTFVSLCVLHAVSPLALADPASPPDAAQIELQALSITGSADAERADGPVQGYKASRSASATRSDTALHETPQSVSVVPKDVLQDTGATRLQDGLDYAGGVGRANNFGGQGLTTFTVRGFTTGEFYRKGLELRGWRERLDFLNRGQRWVARRIAEALPRIPSCAGKRALQQMHESHLANISLCEQLLTD